MAAISPEQKGKSYLAQNHPLHVFYAGLQCIEIEVSACNLLMWPWKIEPFSAANALDNELAIQLKHLSQHEKLDKDLMRFHINGHIMEDYAPLLPNNTAQLRVTLCLKGKSIEFLQELAKDGSVEFEIKMHKLPNTVQETWKCIHLHEDKLKRPYGKVDFTFQMSRTAWCDSFARRIFPTADPAYCHSGPTLSLAVKANLTERMQLAVPIYATSILGHVNGYILPLTMEQEVTKRKNEMAAGLKADVVLEAGNGKEFFIPEKYLRKTGPVFEVMLATGNFLEGRTKRVKIPEEVSEKVLVAFRDFLLFFEMETWINDYDTALNLLQLAGVYQIKLLSDAAAVLLLKTFWTRFTPKQAAKMFALAKYSEVPVYCHKLKKKAVQILNNHPAPFDKPEQFEELFKGNPEVYELFAFLFKNYAFNDSNNFGLLSANADARKLYM